MMVSFNVSPFEELVTLGSVNPITRAPSLFAAVSKLSRVRDVYKRQVMCYLCCHAEKTGR